MLINHVKSTQWWISGWPSLLNEDVGLLKRGLWRKGHYFNFPPFFINFTFISSQNCIWETTVSEIVCTLGRCLWNNKKWETARKYTSFLTQYNEQGDDFLSHTVTKNKRWMSQATQTSEILLTVVQWFHKNNEMYFTLQVVSFYDKTLNTPLWQMSKLV